VPDDTPSSQTAPPLDPEWLVNQIAHTLRNPIFAAMVQAEALMVRSEASEGVIKAMSLVHRQLKRLEADIDEMLLYGRPMTINPRRFHLAGLLKQIAEVFRIGESEEPAHVTVMEGGDDIEVNLDPDAVRMVVERIICNSIQHTELPHDIRVELRPEGADRVTILISDAGETCSAAISPSIRRWARARLPASHSRWTDRPDDP
jgi:signal transduction histidine kinase